MTYKQAIVIRTDLGLGKGKMASQAAHASLAAYKMAGKAEAEEWEEQGSKKVVLKVKSLKELLSLHRQAMQKGLPAAIIRDAGLTQLEKPEITCIGIGPADGKIIDSLTGRLKLL
ncbi:MAG: peptidyl-tRNA hydrolase [Candidatus Aenigmarchaeota archaeon]|nr:peptidyl-tRNA hydrolase [Candidatus Aenigmarchaeota archaeon]